MSKKIRDLELAKSRIVNTVGEVQSSSTKTLLDSDWAHTAFLVEAKGYKDTYDIDIRNRFRSSADVKWQDTQLGGSTALNAFPQYTPCSDPRREGLLAGRGTYASSNATGNMGMGVDYSEYLDDRVEPVYFSMGIPAYNNPLYFWKSFANPTIVSHVRTGRISTTIGKAVGIGAVLLVSVWITSAALTGILFVVGTAVNIFLTDDGSRPYYELKPMMANYLSSVGSLINEFMRVEGTLPRPTAGTTSEQEEEMGKWLTSNEYAELQRVLPNIVRGGIIDYASIVAKNQGRTEHIMKHLHKHLSSEDEALYEMYARDSTATLKQILTLDRDKEYTTEKSLARVMFELMPDNPFFKGVDKDVTNDGLVIKEGDSSQTTTGRERGGYIYEKGRELGELFAGEKSEKEKPVKKVSATFAKSPRWLSERPKHGRGVPVGAADAIKGYSDYSKNVDSLGLRWVCFQFDHVTGHTESFSNNIATSTAQEIVNSAGSGARAAYFNIAGLHQEDKPNALVNLVGSIVNGGLDTLSTMTFGLSNGLTNLLKGANVGLPGYWESSSADLPSASFKTTLISPDQHPFSKLQYKYMPLASFLGMFLPAKVGKNGYASPWTISIFQRGKSILPLCMGKSLTISRGTSTLSSDELGIPLAIEVTMDFADLSPIMPMAVGSTVGGILNIKDIAEAINNTGPMNAYISTVAGKGVYEQVYLLPNAVKRWQRLKTVFGMATSRSQNAAAVREWMVDGPFNTITREVQVPTERWTTNYSLTVAR